MPKAGKLTRAERKQPAPDPTIDIDTSKPAVAKPVTSTESWTPSAPLAKKKGGKKRGSLNSAAARAKREKALEREDRLNAKISHKETRRARNQAGRGE